MQKNDYIKELNPHFDNILKYAKEGEHQVFDYILATIKAMQKDAKNIKGNVSYRDQTNIENGANAIFRFVKKNKKDMSPKVKQIVKKIENELMDITRIQLHKGI